MRDKISLKALLKRLYLEERQGDSFARTVVLGLSVSQSIDNTIVSQSDVLYVYCVS